jgi:hypothetical protein
MGQNDQRYVGDRPLNTIALVDLFQQVFISPVFITTAYGVLPAAQTGCGCESDRECEVVNLNSWGDMAYAQCSTDCRPLLSNMVLRK